MKIDKDFWKQLNVISQYANMKYEIQKIEVTKGNEIIREIKAIEGVTIRQLSRITGISKSAIDRI